MADERKTEDYRRHKLLAAFHKGKYQGRAWKDKSLVLEIEGTSIENVLERLRSDVNKIYGARMMEGAASPKATEYIEAFKKIIIDINEGQFAMLRAHYNAPNRCLTPAALAKAASFKDTGGVNIWYGSLGQWLFEELSSAVSLPIENGKPVYTFALANYISDPEKPEGHKVWKMHEEVASAIEALGLDK